MAAIHLFKIIRQRSSEINVSKITFVKHIFDFSHNLAQRHAELKESGSCQTFSDNKFKKNCMKI